MSKELVKQYQCPGCVLGYNTECGSYKVDGASAACTAHCAGTRFGGFGPTSLVYLGLPKGFNKVGCIPHPPDSVSPNNIRIWTDISGPGWDHLNVPVWASEDDGNLLVRTMCPRIGVHFIDIVEGGTLEQLRALFPNVIDVATFVEDID